MKATGGVRDGEKTEMDGSCSLLEFLLTACQGRGGGVVVSMPLRGQIKAGGGITVGAAKQAGVVHADVPAGHTAAGGPLGRILPLGHVKAENFTDQPVIDTFPRRHVMQCKVRFFGAGLDFHTIGAGGNGKAFHEMTQVFLGRFGDANPLFFHLAEPFCGLSIDIHNADHGTAGMAFQCFRNALVGFLVKIGIGDGAEHDGVVSPNHFFLADAMGQFPKGVQGSLVRRRFRVEYSGIVHEGVEEIVAVSPVVQFL